MSIYISYFVSFPTTFISTYFINSFQRGFFHPRHQLLIFPSHIPIIFFFMRHHTIRTILYSLFCYFIIPSTLFSKSIQWTITKKTTEVFHIRTFMARKIFTFFITKERKVLIFPIFFSTKYPPYKSFFYKYIIFST